jgi:hypothetical protein
MDVRVLLLVFLIFYIIGSYSEYIDTYDSLDFAFKNELYNMPKINSLLDGWSNQIKDAVLEANQKYGAKEPSLQEWIDSINILKFSIEQSLN